MSVCSYVIRMNDGGVWVLVLVVGKDFVCLSIL